MKIEKKLIKEYEKFNLYGIYKKGKLLYKTCDNDKESENNGGKKC